jgi:ribonuclease Z
MRCGGTDEISVEITELQPGDRLHREAYDLVLFDTDHRADSVGYALVEHLRLGRFNPDRARDWAFPRSAGEKLHRGEGLRCRRHG